ncbi:hypothetical protein P775_04955 [Puniceibacterium antarcticum]|uniref:ATP-grasp domain-containing protein n=1 Tax=Puniceibacterium antarcticum TaxID=1206336 RepID=A0A2G8RIW5_9RHOB|nr:ATP-grasp domain-containing protein [Puniceibacterium antarcticum]PIL21341.1 hypothetical protein P775_04955 [Puniceibacterium antarcticum]
MHIHFNHHISCIRDIIEMIRAAHPDVTVSASHAREDHGLEQVLECVTPEMPARPDGGMPIGYTQWLIDIASREGADVVIPYRHRHDLSAEQPLFAQAGLRLLTCGPHDVMSLIEDKTRLLEVAERLGMRISPFRAWVDAEGFRASLEHFGGAAPDGVRLCVKPAQGIYGEGFNILYDDQAANAFSIAVNDQRPHISVQSLHRIVEGAGCVEKMMTMPFLPGRERSVDFACLEGLLLGAVTREKHGSVQLVGHDPEAVGIATALVGALGLSGLANLQTMEDADGRQCLLEVNSRAAGGIGMTGHSGVNLPGLLVSALKRERQSKPVFPSTQVRVLRRQIYEVI